MAKINLQDFNSAEIALRRMTMAEIRTLVALASHSSISGAANALGASQPALSQHLRDLELKLGIPLFERHRRGLTPTSYGNILVRCALSIRSDLNSAANELVSTYLNNTSKLTVGGSNSSTGLLAGAIGKFVALEPNCTTQIIEEPRDQLLEKLRKNRLDLFVGRLPPNHEWGNLNGEVLIQEGAVIVCATNHPLTRKNKISFQQLKTYDWVIPVEGMQFYKQLTDSLSSIAQSLPKAKIEVRSMTALSLIVAKSQMLSFLPWSVYASIPSGMLKALPLDIAWRPEKIGVLMSKHPKENYLLERLTDCLRSAAADSNNSSTQR